MLSAGEGRIGLLMANGGFGLEVRKRLQAKFGDNLVVVSVMHQQTEIDDRIASPEIPFYRPSDLIGHLKDRDVRQVVYAGQIGIIREDMVDPAGIEDPIMRNEFEKWGAASVEALLVRLVEILENAEFETVHLSQMTDAYVLDNEIPASSGSGMNTDQVSAVIAKIRSDLGQVFASGQYQLTRGTFIYENGVRQEIYEERTNEALRHINGRKKPVGAQRTLVKLSNPGNRSTFTAPVIGYEDLEACAEHKVDLVLVDAGVGLVHVTDALLDICTKRHITIAKISIPH